MGKNKSYKKKWGGSVADIVNKLNEKAVAFKNSAQSALGDGEGAIMNAQNNLKNQVALAAQNGQNNIAAMQDRIKAAAKIVTGEPTVEPSPQAPPLAVLPAKPTAPPIGGRRRRTRKSKKSNKRSSTNKRSSRKSKRFTRRMRK